MSFFPQDSIPETNERSITTSSTEGGEKTSEKGGDNIPIGDKALQLIWEKEDKARILKDRITAQEMAQMSSTPVISNKSQRMFASTGRNVDDMWEWEQKRKEKTEALRKRLEEEEFATLSSPAITKKSGFIIKKRMSISGGGATSTADGVRQQIPAHERLYSSAVALNMNKEKVRLEAVEEAKRGATTQHLSRRVASGKVSVEGDVGSRLYWQAIELKEKKQQLVHTAEARSGLDENGEPLFRPRINKKSALAAKAAYIRQGVAVGDHLYSRALESQQMHKNRKMVEDAIATERTKMIYVNPHSAKLLEDKRARELAQGQGCDTGKSSLHQRQTMNFRNEGFAKEYLENRAADAALEMAGGERTFSNAMLKKYTKRGSAVPNRGAQSSSSIEKEPCEYTGAGPKSDLANEAPNVLNTSTTSTVSVNPFEAPNVLNTSTTSTVSVNPFDFLPPDDDETPLVPSSLSVSEAPMAEASERSVAAQQAAKAIDMTESVNMNKKEKNTKSKSTPTPARKTESSSSIFERSQRWVTKRDENIARERKKKEIEELQGCTFEPKLGSALAATSTSASSSSSSQTTTRTSPAKAVSGQNLMDKHLTWAQNKEAQLERQRRELAEKELEGCTFKPSLVKAAAITDGKADVVLKTGTPLRNSVPTSSLSGKKFRPAATAGGQIKGVDMSRSGWENLTPYDLRAPWDSPEHITEKIRGGTNSSQKTQETEKVLETARAEEGFFNHLQDAAEFAMSAITNEAPVVSKAEPGQKEPAPEPEVNASPEAQCVVKPHPSDVESWRDKESLQQHRPSQPHEVPPTPGRSTPLVSPTANTKSPSTPLGRSLGMLDLGGHIKAGVPSRTAVTAGTAGIVTSSGGNKEAFRPGGRRLSSSSSVTIASLLSAATPKPKRAPPAVPTPTPTAAAPGITSEKWGISFVDEPPTGVALGGTGGNGGGGSEPANLAKPVGGTLEYLLGARGVELASALPPPPPPPEEEKGGGDESTETETETQRTIRRMRESFQEKLALI